MARYVAVASSAKGAEIKTNSTELGTITCDIGSYTDGYSRFFGSNGSSVFGPIRGGSYGTVATKCGETSQLGIQVTKDAPYHTFDGWYSGPNARWDYIPDDSQITRLLTSSKSISVAQQGSATHYTDVFDDAFYFIVAKFTPIVYTVTLKGNGASDPPAVSATNPDGAELPTPSRTGYVFDGWYNSDGTEAVIDSKGLYHPTGDVTLYAHWRGATYKVTYDPNGGTVSPESDFVTFGETYIYLPTPQKDGNEFAGWWTKLSGGSRVFAETTVTTASDHTLYAHWNAQITVVFDPNGGNVPSMIYTDVVENSAFGTLPTCEWPSGYGEEQELVGWFTAKDGGTKVVSTTIVTSAIGNRLYAHWKPKGKVLVTFNVNDGVGIASQYYSSGAAYGKLPVALSSNGSSFQGWYSNSSLTTRVTETSIVPSSDTTLYAKWSTTGTYFIRYENPYTSQSQTFEYACGANHALAWLTSGLEWNYPTGMEAKDGKTWMNPSNGLTYANGATVKDLAPKGSECTLVLIAQMKSIIVRLNYNDGTGTTTDIPRRYGDVVGVMPTLTRSGYVFLGWNTAQGAAYNPKATMTGSITLTASWRQKNTVSWSSVTMKSVT